LFDAIVSPALTNLALTLNLRYFIPFDNDVFIQRVIIIIILVVGVILV